jgi:hypothetical protein
MSAYYRSNDGLIETGSSDSAGIARVTLGGGSPVDAYLTMGKTGYVPTRLYPAELWYEAWYVDVPLFQSALIGGVYSTVSGGTVAYDAGKGTVLVRVKECGTLGGIGGGYGVEGATVSFNAAAQAVAYRVPNQTAFSTQRAATSSDGWAAGLNVPPGNVTVQATFKGIQLRAAAVPVRAGEVTIFYVRP